MAKELIEFDVFDAGMNTKAEPINLLPGQSEYMNNILFGDYGSIKTRGGISTYNSTPLTAAAGKMQGIVSYKPSTMSALLVAATNGAYFVLTGAATAGVSIGSIDFAGGQEHIDMVQANGILFMAGPDTPPAKFNGRELTRAGVSAPTQVLSAVSNAAAGNLNGEYRYVYWGVNSYLAEGDYIASPSPVKTIVSGKVRVSDIPTAPASHGIETWKIGRNTAGAAGVYWYLTDKTNGITSFTDNVADADLTELAPTDQGYPRTFQFICSYGGRLWGAVNDYLWYSSVDQPEEFPSTNFIRVGSGSGLNISAIVPFMGMIVISMSGNQYGLLPQPYGQRTALYVLRIGDSIGFNDPENWYLNLVAENEGSESQRACIPVAGHLWMTGRKGVSLFNGAGMVSGIQDTAAGGIVTPKISDPINSLFQITNPSNIRLAAAIEWNNRVYLAINSGASDQNGYPSNETVLVYDYSRVGTSDPRKGGWGRIVESGSAFPIQQFIVHEDKLIGSRGGASTSPYLFQLDNGNRYDLTTANKTTQYMAPVYRMAPVRGKKNHVYHDKDFRAINIWAAGLGELTVTVRIEGVDYDSGTTIQTEVITLTSAGAKSRIPLTSQATGKTLWIQLSAASTVASSGQVDLTITRVQVFYNLRGLRNA